MWIEVKPLDHSAHDKENRVDPYAVDLRLTDRMVRLGTFTRYPRTGETYARNLYRNNDVPVFDSVEEAAYAIAEYQMGAEVANMIPMHLNQDVPH